MIVFCVGAAWDDEQDRLPPGGLADTFTKPVRDNLPDSVFAVVREPRRGALNVFTSNTGSYNTQWVRRTRDSNVHMCHGIADKNYRVAMYTHPFREVFVPGPLHARQLIKQGTPPDKIQQVGYPKLDPVYNGTVTPPPRDERTRVLYAPTHGGGPLCMKSERQRQKTPNARATTFWRKDEVLSRLDPDTFDVVECYHPRHRNPEKATLAEYANADVVIADGGSTIYEALILGIPVVLPAWITGERFNERDVRNTLEGYVYANGIGYRVDNPDELAATVRTASHWGPKLEDEALAETILPTETRGLGGPLHADRLLELHNGHEV